MPAAPSSAKSPLRNSAALALVLAFGCSATDEPERPASSSPPRAAPSTSTTTDELPANPDVAVSKPDPCNDLGAVRCAGHGPPAGLTDILYRCGEIQASGKEWEKGKPADSSQPTVRGWVREGACADGCQEMPTGTQDRCNPVKEIPKSVLEILAPKPYVEENCQPEGAGKKCKYTTLGLDAEVTVMNPDAERVARWTVDAAGYLAPLEAFRTSDPATWEKGVHALAKHVRLQSSRIFPMKGDIVEDMGGGAKKYGFDRGVVAPCEKGNCRCRINSLTPRAYCRFAEAMGGDFDACIAKHEGEKGDEAWRAQCAANHDAAMKSLHNDHFRAKALTIGREVESFCKKRPKGCAPADVVARIEKELGI